MYPWQVHPCHLYAKINNLYTTTKTLHIGKTLITDALMASIRLKWTFTMSPKPDQVLWFYERKPSFIPNIYCLKFEYGFDYNISIQIVWSNDSLFSFKIYHILIFKLHAVIQLPYYTLKIYLTQGEDWVACQVCWNCTLFCAVYVGLK